MKFVYYNSVLDSKTIKNLTRYMVHVHLGKGSKYRSQNIYTTGDNIVIPHAS